MNEILFAILLGLMADTTTQNNGRGVFNQSGMEASIELDVLYDSQTKSYMDYRKITNKQSEQYKYMVENMIVDVEGYLVDSSGFIGVALGSYFGRIGDKFEIELESGVVLKVVKIEEKADIHTLDGFIHAVDGSVIEFVVDTHKMQNLKGENGLIHNGNFNNDTSFAGRISKITKVFYL